MTSRDAHDAHGVGRRASDTPDRRHPVRAYLLAAPYQFGISVAALVASLAYAIDPPSFTATALAERLAWMLPVWEAMYGIGGLFVVIGMLACRHPSGWRLELAGLSLLSAAVIVNAVAVFSTRFPVGLTTAVTFLALAAAGVARAWLLIRLAGVRKR